MHVHTQGVHVRQSLLGVPAEGGRYGLPVVAQPHDQLVLGASAPGHSMPRLAPAQRLQHAVRHQVGVDVNGAHSVVS